MGNDEILQLLDEERAIVVKPKLATLIGLNEAIVLQQIMYWLARSKNVRDGKVWIYKTYDEWAEELPFFSVRTLKRIVDSLRKQGLIETTRKHNKMASDGTLWYTIVGYKNLGGQVGTTQSAKLSPPRECQVGTQVNHILPETTTTSPAAKETTELQRITNLLIWFCTGVNFEDENEDPGRKKLINYGRYAKDAKKIIEAGRTEQDMRAWWSQVWSRDWRFKDKKQLPATNQVLEGLAQVGTYAPDIKDEAVTVVI